MGMNFLSGEDMNAVLSVQLRKRLGLGITANMHVTAMHVEGKVNAVDFFRCFFYKKIFRSLFQIQTIDKLHMQDRIRILTRFSNGEILRNFFIYADSCWGKISQAVAISWTRQGVLC
jgi:hypothetical protein